MSGASAALSPVAVREGHRRLLETFRELADLGPASRGGTPLPEDLRALVSFLRHSVLAFASREDRSGQGDPLADVGAFEHAFLAAEIDALARSIEGLRGWAAGELAAADLDGVRRHLQRIDAVLELHVQRIEDAAPEPGVAAPPGASAEPAIDEPRSSRTRAMSMEEIADFLRARNWGVLATHGPAGAYAVPISYGFGGGTVYFATGPGRKLSNLLADPLVCFTIPNVETANRWESVVISGRAVPVTGVRERAVALNALRRQRGAGVPTAADLARLAKARLFRIEAAEMSGRACG